MAGLAGFYFVPLFWQLRRGVCLAKKSDPAIGQADESCRIVARSMAGGESPPFEPMERVAIAAIFGITDQRVKPRAVAAVAATNCASIRTRAAAGRVDRRKDPGGSAQFGRDRDCAMSHSFTHRRPCCLSEEEPKRHGRMVRMPR